MKERDTVVIFYSMGSNTVGANGEDSRTKYYTRFLLDINKASWNRILHQAHEEKGNQMNSLFLFPAILSRPFLPSLHKCHKKGIVS